MQESLMQKYRVPDAGDRRAFESVAEASLKAKYGLPSSVRFCRKCVISNQRPNSAVEYSHTKDSQKQTIHFDDAGVCDACRLAEQKHHAIDWSEREQIGRASWRERG